MAELDQRLQLGEVGEATNKITWCQLLIGATGSFIFASLDEDATWEDAKEALLTHLGIGSVRDEAWAALKNLKKGCKDIVELAGEAEKLAKRLHPRNEEAAKRHTVDAFLGALDRTLAAEVQKLGHWTMEDVVAAAHRIEKILEEQADSKMKHLVNTMQDQIRILKKDLKEANEQIAAHKAATPPVASMAAIPAPATATAAAAQPPPAAPTRHVYQYYGKEPPFYRPPFHQMAVDLHAASSAEKNATVCPIVLPDRSSNASFVNKLAPEPEPHHEGKSWSYRLNPNVQLKLLEGSLEAKVIPVGCTVRPPITG